MNDLTAAPTSTGSMPPAMNPVGDPPEQRENYCPAPSEAILIMVSLFSLLGCLYVILTYWYVRALRQHPAGILFGMSVYGAFYQFLFILDHSSSSITCSSMAGFVDFFQTGQETYMLLFAIDLLLALKNPFSASKGLMKRYHLFCMVWSILFAVLSRFDTNYSLFGFCWMDASTALLVAENYQQGDNNGATSSSSTARIPGPAAPLPIANGANPGGSNSRWHVIPTSGLFFALFVLIVYCTSLCALLRTWNTFLKGLRDTFKTRQRIHRHLKYYVGCYFGYWTLVLACYAVFSVFPRDAHEMSQDSNDFRCRVWHLLSYLLLAKGLVNSLIWTRTSNILKVLSQLRECGFVDLPAHDDTINWALRLEILTNTTKGICESVNRAERKARLSANTSCQSAPSCSTHGGPVGVSNSTSAERPSCCSGLSQFGDIATATAAAANLCRTDPEAVSISLERKEYYSQIEEIIIENRSHHRHLGGTNSEGIVFFDYAPQVFRQLRLLAKVSCEKYRHSFQQTTKERVSEGKSGAFFYFTQDSRYVVKTLTNEELKFLLSILPKYYTFIKSNPDTFVTRFFGCHALTMYGKTVFFVVMQSVFDTRLQIHERFDLKGSWVGRLEGRKPTGTVATCKFCNAEYIVGSHEQLCDVRCAREGNLRHQYDQVGKDLNWNRHMTLPRSTAREVARQLVKDSNFLCELNCIDYSLLVGIHHRTFNVSHLSSADFSDTEPRISNTDDWHQLEMPVSTSTSTSQPKGSFFGLERESASSVIRESSCTFLQNKIDGMRGTSGSGEATNGSGDAFSPSKPFHQAIHGGMTVEEVHGPGIYFMGLIDILQQWNCRKRVEHFVRVYILMQDCNGISVVNPKYYAQRFQQRVIRELIYDSTGDIDEVLNMNHHPNPQMMGHNVNMSALLDSSRTMSTVLNSIDFAMEQRIHANGHAGAAVNPHISSLTRTPPSSLPSLTRVKRATSSGSSALEMEYASSTGFRRSSGLFVSPSARAMFRHSSGFMNDTSFGLQSSTFGPASFSMEPAPYTPTQVIPLASPVSYAITPTSQHSDSSVFHRVSSRDDLQTSSNRTSSFHNNSNSLPSLPDAPGLSGSSSSDEDDFGLRSATTTSIVYEPSSSSSVSLSSSSSSVYSSTESSNSTLSVASSTQNDAYRTATRSA